MAQAEQVTCLLRIRLLPKNRGKRRNCRGEITLAIMNQANIQADAVDFWRQLRCFFQEPQSMLPILSPHGDHAEIRVRSRGVWVDRNRLSESLFCAIQVAALQRQLPLRE